MLTLIIALQLAGTITPPPIPPSPAPTFCRVVVISPKSAAAAGGAGRLMAVCGKRGAPLGAATRYSTTTNPLTGSVLVVRVRGGNTEVLVVSPTSGGVAVDDITRDLARLAGRFGDLGLGPFTVDATRFAVDGSVGVAASGAPRWLDLASYAARAAKAVTAALPTSVPTGAGLGATTITGVTQ